MDINQKLDQFLHLNDETTAYMQDLLQSLHNECSLSSETLDKITQSMKQWEKSKLELGDTMKQLFQFGSSPEPESFLSDSTVLLNDSLSQKRELILDTLHQILQIQSTDAKYAAALEPLFEEIHSFFMDTAHPERLDTVEVNAFDLILRVVRTGFPIPQELAEEIENTLGFLPYTFIRGLLAGKYSLSNSTPSDEQVPSTDQTPEAEKNVYDFVADPVQDIQKSALSSQELAEEVGSVEEEALASMEPAEDAVPVEEAALASQEPAEEAGSVEETALDSQEFAEEAVAVEEAVPDSQEPAEEAGSVEETALNSQEPAEEAVPVEETTIDSQEPAEEAVPVEETALDSKEPAEEAVSVEKNSIAPNESGNTTDSNEESSQDAQELVSEVAPEEETIQDPVNEIAPEEASDLDTQEALANLAPETELLQNAQKAMEEAAPVDEVFIHPVEPIRNGKMPSEKKMRDLLRTVGVAFEYTLNNLPAKVLLTEKQILEDLQSASLPAKNILDSFGTLVFKGFLAVYEYDENRFYCATELLDECIRNQDLANLLMQIFELNNLTRPSLIAKEELPESLFRSALK